MSGEIIKALEDGKTGHDWDLNILEYITGRPSDWKPGDGVEPFTTLIDSAVELVPDGCECEIIVKEGYAKVYPLGQINPSYTQANIPGKPAAAVCVASLRMIEALKAREATS